MILSKILYFDSNNKEKCHKQKGKKPAVVVKKRRERCFAESGRGGSTISCQQNRTEPGIMDRRTIHDSANSDGPSLAHKTGQNRE
jgi:hypothetical protein